LWAHVRTDMIYHADGPRLLRTSLRWLALLTTGWLVPGLRDQQPRSLPANQPLGELLKATLDLDRLRDNLSAGLLHALAITATAYTTGEHLTFYQSHATIKPWQRSLREAIPCSIGIDHLLASSAIPFVFP